MRVIVEHCIQMSHEIEKGLKKAGVRTAERHLFLCLGPDCCSPCDGQKTWKYIKQRVNELGLHVMRTKTQCFRICAGGPWLVVYPEGIWYGNVTPKRFERILQEHLIGGAPVSEWIAVRNSLGEIAPSI